MISRYLSPEPLLQPPVFVDRTARIGMHVPTYAYAANSPLRFSDPTGLCFWDACVGEAAVWYVLGGAITAAILAIEVPKAIDGTRTLLNENRSSKPDDCPTGTKPIDQVGWDRGKIHGVKDAIGAGPKDWVGVDAHGNVWGHGEEGAENWGPWTDLIPGAGK